MKEDLTAQGMNTREAVDNSRNRRILLRPDRRRTPDGGEIELNCDKGHLTNNYYLLLTMGSFIFGDKNKMKTATPLPV